MPNLSAFGLTVTTPAGWDGEIYLPQQGLGPTGEIAGEIAGPLRSADAPSAPEVVPILHVANFPLPPQRGDYGGGAVDFMGPDDLFVSLLEHPADEAATALFAHSGLVWPLTVDDFSPQAMQRRLPGQAGCQRFFTHLDRAFCLYAVIGSYQNRRALVPKINTVLAGVSFG